MNKLCEICHSNNCPRIHDFGFINLYRCSNCQTIFAGKNKIRNKIRTDDWGEESGELDSYYWEQFRIKDKEYLKVLSKLNIKPPGKILDVGCGPATFLYQAKKIGWQVSGVEPSKSFCQIAKNKFGLKITNDVFKEKYFTGEQFKIISMFDVLEHFDNPKQFIKRLIPFFNHEGYLMLTIPNYSSFTIKLCLLSYYLPFGLIKAPVKMVTQVDYNYHHTYYFTKETIAYLLNNLGFDLVFLKSISTILADHFFQRLEFKFLPKFVKRSFSLLLFLLQQIESFFDARDTMILIAKISKFNSSKS